MGSASAAPADVFKARFGTAGRQFSAPGRVNLIGEHVDYNDGLALPMAIDRRTRVWASPRGDRRLSVIAYDLGEEAELDLDAPARLTGTWRDYVAGVAFHLERAGFRLGGANLLVTSDVPAGAGLSSSAALEVAVGFALLALAGHDIDRLALACAGQAAEHDFVGTRCGLMDQFVAAHARAGRAIRLDCRTRDFDLIPLDATQCAVVVADTGKRHRLATSAYNARRRECETALTTLRQKRPALSSLREVTPADLDAALAELSAPLARRVRHVVTEIERVEAFARALAASDWTRAGALLTDSHRSLREDYEASCAELDALVAAAQAAPGCHGARMTGGGFGGCTVNLVAPAALEAFLREVPLAYERATGRATRLWVVAPSDGVGETIPERA
ncbi:MAG: galactokinase [Chloracidobacterium sp. CP2_5A]|nr:MAG: galactokinase [Chloracidobacterium sp. CP2_5A]